MGVVIANVNWKDVLVRAVKTAVQTYVAAWLLTQDPFTKASLIAPVAATVSAVWNVVAQSLSE